MVINSIVIGIVFGLPLLFGVILFLFSLVAFSVNVIQFGMDQVHDAPADSSMLYIHWYIWTLFLGSLVVRIPLVAWSYLYTITCLATAPLALGITLCIHRYKRNWYLAVEFLTS